MLLRLLEGSFVSGRTAAGGPLAGNNNRAGLNLLQSGNDVLLLHFVFLLSEIFITTV